MSDHIEWETIETPRGAFIGWGTREGQHVTGKVMEYSPLGGRDFNDEPCPQLTVELTEKAASFNKAGDRTDFDAGELVNLTIGQASLKAAIKRADPAPGDLVKVKLNGTEKTNRGNTVKVFDVKIARNASSSSSSSGGGAFDAGAVESQPPF